MGRLRRALGLAALAALGAGCGGPSETSPFSVDGRQISPAATWFRKGRGVQAGAFQSRVTDLLTVVAVEKDPGCEALAPLFGCDGPSPETGATATVNVYLREALTGQVSLGSYDVDEDADVELEAPPPGPKRFAVDGKLSLHEASDERASLSYDVTLDGNGAAEGALVGRVCKPTTCGE